MNHKDMKRDTFPRLKSERVRQWLLFWLVVGIGCFALVFFLTGTWIGLDVREHCLIAKSRYGGDCVESLIRTVEDESNDFHERNDAIWSLGQLGDPRGESVLKKYHTGTIPNREKYDEMLSQHEIRKARRLIESGFNVTHFVWYDEELLK